MEGESERKITEREKEKERRKRERERMCVVRRKADVKRRANTYSSFKPLPDALTVLLQLPSIFEI